jgi:hypothetical protein
VSKIQIAAAIVEAEVAAAGRADDPEWIAGSAMCYVQARVRPWRETQRIAAGFGFTVPASSILAFESGYCGSCILAWRAILAEHEIKTRQIGLMWTSEMEPYQVGHVCAEAYWDDAWHFFDVMTGTVWRDDDGILPWERVRLNPDEESLRISNEASIRYTSYEEWFAADPFAYLHVEPLTIEYLVDDE